jgi:long-chain acyl-CoA synthetase
VGATLGAGAPSVRAFLSGKTLLITGSTGFLAKALVEKILFEAPDVGRLYLLIRPQRRGAAAARGTTAQARLDKEILESPAMGRIRLREGERYAAFARQKVVAVAGDLARAGLDLSGEDRARLLDEVDVVVNSAATVVFDERIDQALALNTRAPREILALARAARKRPVLVQISTCYVCGKRTGFVPEAIAESPAGPGEPRPPEDLDREVAEIEAEVARVTASAESAAARRRFRDAAARAAGRVPTQAEVEAAKEEWLRERLVAFGMRRARDRGWNDTYTYTKAMGERFVMRERGDLPTVIIRPSIIESSLREPVPGWIDGYRMADPLIAAYGRGRLELFPARPEVGLDIVPLDHTVNAILAALPRAATQRGLAVYQIASTSQNCLTVRRMVELMTSHFAATPMRDAAGRAIRTKRLLLSGPALFRLRCLLRYHAPLAALRLATAPLAFVPAVRRFRRALEVRAKALGQLTYFSDIYGPYTCLDCRFGTENTRALLASLSGEDRARFAFDAASIDWAEYIDRIHIPGLRRNVLQAEALPTGEWAGMERVIEKAHAHEAGHAEGWEGLAELPPPVATAAVPSGAAAAAPAIAPDVGSLRDLVARSAAAHPTRVALQVQRAGVWTRVTYAELLERADTLGRRLAACGLRAEERAVLWSESRPEWGIAYVAITGIGAAAVPADPQLPEADLLGLVEITRARLVVASAGCLARLGEAGCAALRARAVVVRIGDAWTLDSGEPLPEPRPEARIERAAVGRDTIASILFTSGTTVAPKGVMLTHGSFLANVRMVRSIVAITPDDAFLSVLPLFHAFEFTAGFLTPLSAGASVTYLSELRSTAIVEAMRETHTTVLLGVPRLYALLYDGVRRRIEESQPIQRALFAILQRIARAALAATGSTAVGRVLFAKIHRAFGGRLRLLVSGGAALDKTVYREFREMGLEIVEGYGLTETAPVLTMNPPGASRVGSVGPALPGVALRIGRPNTAGVGEVIVSGPNVMRGYFERPDETAKVLAGGWFRTGDLGYLDADGYLYLTGRIKDLIVTAAGKNVYPDEIEAHFRSLPGVRDFTIIGVRPHGALGEEVHAVVVPDAADGAGELARIRAAFAARAEGLPSHQHVQAVHLWDGDLPKTSTLKVKRSRVKAAIEARIAEPRRADGGRRADARPAGGRPAWRDADLVLAFLSRLTGIPVSEIAPSKSLELDLAVDSLMRVEIAAFLSSRFGVALSPDEELALKTAGDVIAAAARGPGEPEIGEAETSEVVAYWERRLADGGAAARPRDIPPSLLHATARAAILGLGRAVYAILFRLRWEGVERVPDAARYIIAANHSSHLDAMAVILALGPRAARLRAVVAKDYFFRTRLSSWFFGRLLRAIPFDRHENFVEGLDLCRAALEANHPLLIFPEGTRSATGELQSFKVGVGILARGLGVPIVPAYIEGAYDALPRGSAIPRPGRIRVLFGEPIEPAAHGARAGESAYEAYKATVEAVRRSIETMRDAARGSAP